MIFKTSLISIFSRDFPRSHSNSLKFFDFCSRFSFVLPLGTKAIIIIINESRLYTFQDKEGFVYDFKGLF